MRHLFTIFFIGVLAAGCGDSTTSTSDGGSGGGTSSTSNGGSGGGAPTTSNGGTGGGSSSSIDVVINEIQAQNEDYVELVNIGSAAFDLSGYGVADSLSTGGPKLDAAARFPAGTTLGAGDRLLLVAEQDPVASVGPHDICLTTGGPSSCYYATWGISAANGEKLYLLGPDDAVAGEAAYPMNGAPAGSSWGRLPDGTGDFQVTALTPGAVNQAP